MTEKTRQAIVVLGMHRSGTSALTGILALLGARPPARQLPRHLDNPKGYFESAQIVAIHDRLLAAAGTSWLGLDRIPDDWFRSAQAESFIDQLVAAVQQDFDDAALFVIKDPRICRLVPIWRKVLSRVGAEPHFAVMLRNPLEVARSLKKRDGLPLVYGCLLWLGHILEAEHRSRNFQRVFANYDDLLRDPAGTAKYVGAQLGVDVGDFNSHDAHDIEEFIDVTLRHQHVETKEIKALSVGYSWLPDTYEAIAQVARNPIDKKAQDQLDRIQVRFDRALMAFSPFVAMGESVLNERSDS